MWADPWMRVLGYTVGALLGIVIAHFLIVPLGKRRGWWA